MPHADLESESSSDDICINRHTFVDYLLQVRCNALFNRLYSIL